MVRISPALALLALLAAGCQIIGGYKDFEAAGEEGGSAGAGQAGEGGASSAGGTGGAAGAAGEGPAGSGGGTLDCASRPPPSAVHADRGPTMVGTLIGKLDNDTGKLINTSCAWVDSTEVTFQQYGAFLTDSGVGAAGGPSTGSASQADESCKMSNLDLRPSAACLQGQDADTVVPRHEPQLPVVCLDECDAAAFCAWAGKQLCDGGPGDIATENPMFMACSSGHRFSFPYGSESNDTYQSNHCNENHFPITACPDTSCATEVGTLNSCETTDKVFDLVGNVAEWTGACNGSGTGQCTVRGGAFSSDASNAQCDATTPLARDQHRAHIGFRCCALGS